MNPEDLYRQAQALQSSGEHGKAAKVYKQLVAATSDARFHIAYGACLQQLRHWQESILQFQRGIDLRPAYAEGDARLMLAASFLEAGQRLKAIEQWRIVASMPPAYPSYESVPDAAKALLARHAV